jgi:hypothetical protein
MLSFLDVSLSQSYPELYEHTSNKLNGVFLHLRIMDIVKKIIIMTFEMFADDM